MNKLGKYEVLGELGHGAMGVVYRARDPIINRLVALKTITSGVADNPAMLERFYREAQSAGGLQHPNIVTIYDMGEAGSVPYIAMELVEGENLEQVIARRSALPVTLKLVYAIQACRALDYAHKRGIVHRDIKPGNVMVSRDGAVKVVDFGIARVLEASRTQTGMLIGTFAYMSPEQYHGEHADERSDIWSLGVMLYELLCYRRPFMGASPASLMNCICHDEPPLLSTLLEDCPAELEVVVSKLLRKSPKERYQSMEDVVLDLEPVCDALRSKSVSALMEHSRELYEQGGYTDARDLLRQVLQVEPGNQQARALLEKANLGVKRMLNRPKAQLLVDKGKTFLSDGRLQEARSAAASALQLDSEFAPAEELLQAIKAEVDRARLLVEWFEAAKQNLAEGLPNEAEALLNKVLEAEPANEQAQALLEQVHLEKIEGEKRRRLFDSLQQARELWTRQDYAGCVALLGDLGQEFPEEEEVLRLLETVREDQLEQQKQQDLLQSRDLLAAGRYEESLALLERLQKQFPSDEEIPRLLEEVRQDQMSQRRMKGLAEARSLLTSGQYEECISCLTALRATFPDEHEVAQLLESAHQSQAEQIRQRGVNEANELLAARRLEDCARLLTELEKQFPGDAEILGLQKAVGDEQAEQARQQSLGEARNLLAGGRLDECVALLEGLEKQYPDDADILRLQFAIQEERLQQRRRQSLEEARSLLSARNYPQAVALLTALQREFPEDEDTCRLLESANKEQADQQKRDGLSEANKLLAARKFEECIGLLSKLQADFPSESGIARLLEYARKGQAEQRLRAGLDQARTLLAERLYDQSIQLLSQLQTEFPGETEIIWLLTTAREDLAELEKQQKLAQARSLLAGRSFAEALGVLDGLEAAHPKDSAAGKLRLVVQREQEQHAKAEKVQHELDELKKLMSEKKYPQVIARTRQLLTVFPGEANFIRLGEFAAGRQATIEMDLLRQKTLERVQASIAAGRFEAAAQLAKKGLKALPGNAELQGLLHEAETQQKKQQVRQEIEHRIREIRVKIVREELSEAIDLAEKTLATLGPDTDLNHLLSSAQVEMHSREQKRIREQSIETIRSLVESGKLDAATQMLGNALSASTLTSFDPGVQRLQEMIEDAKRPSPEPPAPGPVSAAPAVPGLSKEYAFLQAAPLPSAPPGPADSAGPISQAPVSDRPTNRPQYVARAAPAPLSPAAQEVVLPSLTQIAAPPEADVSGIDPAPQESDISGIDPTPRMQVEPVVLQPATTEAKPAVVPTEVPTPRIAPATPRPSGRAKSTVAPKSATPATPKSAPPAAFKSAPPAATKFPPPGAPKVAPPAAGKAAPPAAAKVAPPAAAKVVPPAAAKIAPPAASVPIYRRPIVLGAGALAILVAIALPFLSHKTSSPTAPSPAASSPVASQSIEQPAKPAPNPVEMQQRQALDAANKLIAVNDLNGAIQQLRPAASLKGPLTNDVTQKISEIQESMKDAGLRDLRQREEKVWQRAIKNAAGGHFAEAQKEFKEILAFPAGGVHTGEAQQNLDKMLAQSKAQNALLAQGRQNLAQGDFSSARRTADQLKQNGGDPAVLTAGIDRAEQVQLKQLETTFDQLKQRDDDTAMQQLSALQPKFQSLASDGGPQSAEAATYANKIPSTMADIRSHSVKRSGDAAFDKLVQRSRQATTANDKSGLAAVRSDFQAIAQGGGPRADSAQQYVTDLTKKLDVLNTPAQVAPPVQAPTPPPAATREAPKEAPSTALVDEPAVRSVVQSFFQAFEQRSPDALRQAWPGIPKKRYDAYKDSFANMSAISIQVVGENVKIGPDGTTATVSVESVLVETPKSDSKQRRFSPGWTFQLSKSDNYWRITSVQ